MLCPRTHGAGGPAVWTRGPEALPSGPMGWRSCDLDLWAGGPARVQWARATPSWFCQAALPPQLWVEAVWPVESLLHFFLMCSFFMEGY